MPYLIFRRDHLRSNLGIICGRGSFAALYNTTPDLLLRYEARAGAIIGDGDRKRAPFLVLGLIGPMIWDNFSIFRTFSTCFEDFCGRVAQGKWRPKFPKSFTLSFGPLLNTFMSVGILFKYLRRKLLQFE